MEMTVEKLRQELLSAENNIVRAVDYCFELSGEKTDIRAFAKALGIEIISNSSLRSRRQKEVHRMEVLYGYYYSIFRKEDSRIYHDISEEKFYIVIDDSLSRATQQVEIAYDIAMIVLDQHNCKKSTSTWDKSWKDRFLYQLKTEREIFAERLLELMDDEDDSEMSDELEFEVVEE